MKRILIDRGVQASATTGLILTVGTLAGGHPAVAGALWVTWAGLTVWAITTARKRHA